MLGRRWMTIAIPIILVIMVGPVVWNMVPVSGSKEPEHRESSSQIVIGAAIPELQGSFWVSMYYGMTDEADKLGVKLKTLNAGGYDQIQRQIHQIENLTQNKVDVLLVGATNGEAVRQVVAEAMNKGIPVIGLSSLPEPRERLLSAIGADHYGMGALQAQCLSAEMGGKGQVAVMAGPPGVTWATERLKGFRETVAKESPGIRLVAEKATPTGRVEGVKLMEDWLQAYPDIAGVFTAVDDLGAGAVDALLAANKAGMVKVSSSNLSPIGEEYLRKGLIQCQSIQQIVLQGREAIRQAIAFKEGREVKALIKTPVLLVTESNIDKLDYSQIKAPKDFRP